MFNDTEQNKLKTLGEIARKHLGGNDKRVANAICEAFEILDSALRLISEQRLVMPAFEKHFGLSAEEAVEEFMVACYNTAQYERGLEMCNAADRYGLWPKEDILSERAELYGHLGECSKAEKILSDLIKQDPDNVQHYINYGDLYYVWQVLPEEQNLERAESWYYKAFDRHLGAGTENGLSLLERLGEVCVERLRRSSEKRLLEMMERLSIGYWPALAELRRTVYLTGPESVVLNHLQMKIHHKVRDIKEANQSLGILMNAYNLMPQRDLHDVCPSQMAEYYAQGEHTARIIAEKFDAFHRAVEEGRASLPTSTEGAEAFSEFQEKFMAGLDEATSKKRSDVLRKEQKDIEKLIKKGEFIWTGFIKFRHIGDLAEMNPE